jgi:transposase
VIGTLIEKWKLVGIDPHIWLAATLTSLLTGQHASLIEKRVSHTQVAENTAHAGLHPDGSIF